MEKYKSLVNRKINVEFNGKVVNSYKIIKMYPSVQSMHGRGKLYRGNVTWEKDYNPDNPTSMDFDEQTMNELLSTGISMCPGLSNLMYVLVG